MRLIDLDEHFRLNEPFYATGVKMPLDEVKNVLENTPIVKAIPIELIKKEMKRLDEDIKWAWYYGNTALDKMEYLKMWLTIKLEEWEKENERDDL